MRETIHTLASQNTRSSLLEPKGLVVAKVLVGSQIYSQNWSPAPPVSAVRRSPLQGLSSSSAVRKACWATSMQC